MADIDGWSFLVDGALVLQRAGYDRVDSGGNPQPHVDGADERRCRCRRSRSPTSRARSRGRGSRSASASGCRISASTPGRRTARSATATSRSTARCSASSSSAASFRIQRLVLARRRPAEHDPALPQPRDALGLLGAQLRARGSRLRRAHPGRHRLGVHAVGRHRRHLRVRPRCASASTCSCRSSCARRARWRRGCRPIRSSPTPRCTATPSASTSTCR